MDPFSPLLEHAAEFAAEWHAGTYRKSRWRPCPYLPPAEQCEGPPEDAVRVPMVAHVTSVAMTVLRAGFPDETVAAAFLHDVLEDPNQFGQTISAAELAALFGREVVEQVETVSEPKRDADGRMLPWKQRKDSYVRALASGPLGAAAISLADKLHNLWTMNEGLAAGHDIFVRTRYPDGTPRGLSAGPEQQRWYFNAVIAATEAHNDPRLDVLRDRLRAELARFEALTGATV